MIYLQLALLIGLALVAFVSVRALTVPTDHRRPASVAGVWRIAHYDDNGSTQVILEKVSTPGEEVVDEHLVASLPVDDPDYDEKFLAAMATARERRALFESEEH